MNDKEFIEKVKTMSFSYRREGNYEHYSFQDGTFYKVNFPRKETRNERE